MLEPFFIKYNLNYLDKTKDLEVKLLFKNPKNNQQEDLNL